MEELKARVPGRAKYRDAEFSDIEIEALMEYFRVSTYRALKSVLTLLKKSSSEF